MWRKIPNTLAGLQPIPIIAALALVLGWVLRLYRSSALVYFTNAVVVRGLNYGLAAVAAVVMHQFSQALRLFRTSETS